MSGDRQRVLSVVTCFTDGAWRRLLPACSLLHFDQSQAVVGVAEHVGGLDLDNVEANREPRREVRLPNVRRRDGAGQLAVRAVLCRRGRACVPRRTAATFGAYASW